VEAIEELSRRRFADRMTERVLRRDRSIGREL
jgi:hypothetical protein